MHEIGKRYEFADGSYELVENNIVSNKNKTKLILWLNIWALIFIFVFVVIQLFINSEFNIVFDTKLIIGLLIFLVAYILFVVAHELLHGAAFMVFGKVARKNVKFGIVWKSGMAYCISTIPVKVKASRLSLMMPIYVICLPLYIYSLITKDSVLAIIAILFASGSVGDFYYMWKLRSTSNDLYMYEEMPTKSGYEVGYLLLKKVESVQ